MPTKRIITIIALLIFVAITPAIGGQYDEQLKIYKSTLNSSPDDQMRISAAKQILLCPDGQCKEIVGWVLENGDEKAATALLKAILDRDNWDTKISNEKECALSIVRSLKTPKPGITKLACEALGSFNYDLYKNELKKQLLAPEQTKQARMSSLYALSLNLTEKDAITTMITLLDDSDVDISNAAGEALQIWVPVGNDRKLWGQFLDELEKKSPEEIVRDRLALQEMKVKNLEQKNRSIEDELISTLDKLFDLSKDTTTKTQLITEKLASNNSSVRLWAVKKTEQWRNNSEVPAEIKEKLKTLIADESFGIRIATAKLMVYLAECNPSEELYNQIQVEKYSVVRLAHFEALTESCYFGLMQSSKIKVRPEIRLFTLNTAKEMLKTGSPEQALSAVEAVRKLLDRNGIEDKDTEPYYQEVLNRFNSSLKSEVNLAADILKRSAGFFAANSHYRSVAIKLFEPDLIANLNNENEAIVGAAITCLDVINKSNALKLIRNNKIYDRSPELYKFCLKLANEAGNAEDLAWLEEKLSSQEDSLALMAIKKVMENSDSKVSDLVISHIQSYKVTDEQKQDLLETAVRKNNLSEQSLSIAANAYYSRNKIEQASDCYKKLLAKNAIAHEQYMRVLDIFAKTSNIAEMSKIIGLILSNDDIAKDSEAGIIISGFLNSADINEGKKLELKTLIAAIPAEGKPKWAEFINTLVAKPAPAKETPATE